MEEYTLQSAKDTAMTYLSYQSHTSAEVRKHLKEKGYSGEDISECLEFLLETNLVNDGEYAQRYIEKCQEKGRGPKRIERELAEKGIEASLLQNRMEVCYDKSVEFEIAKDLAEKLWGDLKRKESYGAVRAAGYKSNPIEDVSYGQEDGFDECDDEYGSEESDFSEDGRRERWAVKSKSNWGTGAQKKGNEERKLREKQLAKIARKLEYQGFSSGVVFAILKSLK